MAFEFDLATTYKAVQAILQQHSDPQKAFSSLLAFVRHTAGEKVSSPFESFDLATEIGWISEDVAETLESEPPGQDIKHFYFGLFQAAFTRSEQPSGGFYMVGLKSIDENDLDSLCDPEYKPSNRYLQSNLLDLIVCKADEDAEYGSFLSYAMMLGCGGILSREVLRNASKSGRFAVGFDDGDVLFLELN